MRCWPHRSQSSADSASRVSAPSSIQDWNVWISDALSMIWSELCYVPYGIHIAVVRIEGLVAHTTYTPAEAVHPRSGLLIALKMRTELVRPWSGRRPILFSYLGRKV